MHTNEHTNTHIHVNTVTHTHTHTVVCWNDSGGIINAFAEWGSQCIIVLWFVFIVSHLNAKGVIYNFKREHTMNFQIVIKTGTQIFNWMSFQHTHTNTNIKTHLYDCIPPGCEGVSVCVGFSIDMNTTNICTHT